MARASGVALFAGLLIYGARGRAADVPPVATVARRWPLLVAVGLGDLGGNVFFLLADSRGPLSIAVVLSSLYPVTTALLAWLLLRERLGSRQVAGAALAVAAIILLAA
jgi:drug/metabolite transporter (DMT)-like permease